MKSAHKVFWKLPFRDLISWNALISGHSQTECLDEAFKTFRVMQSEQIRPIAVTAASLLSVCALCSVVCHEPVHAGRVQMGWKYFKSMVEDYKLEPQVEHYTCMVDLLGRAGHLNKAYDLIMAMSCVPDDRIWGSLLGSCRAMKSWQNL
ncbi:hypothetical protein Ddye_002341 [Dipteronia dyeriana]|uniref:Pentatricopeptide repeat-containing protein n=1 Tax=Dipteronia dyeriana TaxID=168575 RepID=A0AAD9XRB6_9ROSI|nr:hypothetical protein Ddye_002341 [Dipteronia dyeriana]